MKPKLVVWGASGHAKVVADIVLLRNEFILIGFLDDVHLNRRGENFCGVTVLGGAEQLPILKAQGATHMIVAFGDNKLRLEKTNQAEISGFKLAIVIHPKAVIAADTKIGLGSVVAAGAVINPGSVLGKAVIVNTSAIVDHDCSLEDGVHICPGANLAGRVRIGERSWIGTGATIRDGTSVGARTIVGAGAVVLQDMPSGVYAYGVPARVVRNVDEDDTPG